MITISAQCCGMTRLKMEVMDQPAAGSLSSGTPVIAWPTKQKGKPARVVIAIVIKRDHSIFCCKIHLFPSSLIVLVHNKERVLLNSYGQEIKRCHVVRNRVNLLLIILKARG